MCPNPGGFGEEFYSNGSRAGLLVRIRVCARPVLFNLASGGSRSYQTVTVSGMKNALSSS